MNKSVIIVAGGNGSRMGGDLPKQFLLLENYPVLMWTILNFIRYESTIEVVVALPESQINYWNELCLKYNFAYPHRVVAGGETRFQSVKNGVAALGITDLVAVHDGVRPLVSQLTISNCFNQAEALGAAIPVLPVNETLRTGTMEESQTVDRTQFYTVQTPQIFKVEIIKAAYSQTWEPSFTDDASVVEQAGYPIRMVLGNRDNIKITHPEDLLVASGYLKQKKGTF